MKNSAQNQKFRPLAEDKLAKRLLQDSMQINGNLDDQQRQALFAKLAHQTVIPAKPVSHFSQNLAIAASLLVTLSVASFIMAPNNLEQEKRLAEAHPTVPLALEADRSAARASDSYLKLESKALRGEYQAVLADLNKLKQKIVAL